MDRKHLPKAAALLGILIFLAGLLLFIYAGTFSRFWADDYCYSATVKQMGLLRGLVDWYHSSGNRLSTLVVVAFVDLFGMHAIRFSALFVLALWVGAWLFFLTQLCRLLQWNVAWYWRTLLAVVSVYFAVLLAPDRLQTIYWRMGTFHYTLPMPLLLLNLGLLIAYFRAPGRGSAWASQAGAFLASAILASALLAAFAAGLSETFAAMQAGLVALVAIAVLLFTRGGRGWQAARLLAAPLAGSLAMMALMTQAPANAWRQAVMPPPDNLLLVIPYSLRYAADFITLSLRGQIVPYLVYLVAVGAVALLAVPADCFRLSLRAGLAAAAAALLGMYALVVCSFAPSAYAGLAYPAGRALMPGAFALLVGLGTAVFLLALSLRRAVIPPAYQGRLALAAVLALIIVFLYPFRAAGVAQADLVRLSANAARWDARSAQIVQSVRAGDQDIAVQQVEVVQSLEDMGPNPTHWINSCAAVFYGARTITANP